jgi:regulator of replication initiation timing
MQRIRANFARICRLLIALATAVCALPNPCLATQEEVAAAAEANPQALATPTHHQTGVIKAAVEGLPQRELKCFCLTPDNRIVAGCAGGEGELRVFDEAGEYVESWSAPFAPEAIFVRNDGKIFLAGEGKLARLSSKGEIEKQIDSPHAASMSENLDKIRKDVVEQHKRQSEMFTQQAEQYDQLIKQADDQVSDLKKQISELADDAAAQKPQLEQQLAMREQMKQQYEQVKKQWDEMAARQKPKDLTDDQIDELVKQSIQYKQQASSISATDDEVFLATHAAVGYGFDVWKMDADFAGGETIITGLSGCCGQMDVKAGNDGLFVAENSKHRVCRYDSSGKMICNWGHGARTGIEGFGSCCNPMNVAFGPEGVVYTAEDNTGRIKRYSPDGKLLGLVGSVELVPGCKNCSIAVSSDGTRVYMLDITRGHIVRMEPYKPGEAPAPAAVEEEPAAEAALEQSALDHIEAAEPSVAVAKGVLKVLGFGD